MKLLISSTVALGLFCPAGVFAQQVNYYQTQQCSTYQETYVPGYYDNYGNYVQGRVNVYRYNNNCAPVVSTPVVQPVVVQPQYYRQRVCNPTAGALMGAGLASALSGGSGWTNSGSWNRYYGRNRSSGSWSNSYQNRNNWGIFGAGLGALMYSC